MTAEWTFSPKLARCLQQHLCTDMETSQCQFRVVGHYYYLFAMWNQGTAHDKLSKTRRTTPGPREFCPRIQEKKHWPTLHLVEPDGQAMVSNVWSNMEERDRDKWCMSYGQTCIWRGKTDEQWAEVGDLTAIRGHGDVWTWASVGPMSGFVTLMQPWSPLISLLIPSKAERLGSAELALAITRENWFCPSLAETLRREGPSLFLGYKIELTQPWSFDNWRAGSIIHQSWDSMMRFPHSSFFPLFFLFGLNFILWWGGRWAGSGKVLWKTQK